MGVNIQCDLKSIPKLYDGRVYVYKHAGFDFVYYGITNDPEGRWRWGKGYEKQNFGKLIIEKAKEEGKILSQYWLDDMEHEILSIEDSRKLAELCESLLIVRNGRKGLKVVNGNNGAGVKYVEGWQEMCDEELIEALMKEYQKEKGNVIQWE